MQQPDYSTVRVAVRLKPMLNFDNSESLWEKQSQTNIGRGEESYTYDQIIDQMMMNADVYESLVKSLVASAVDGYNVALCAYGQSGAGKTHTLTGSGYELGIVQHTLEDIFRQISVSTARRYMIRMSYLEIYNEKITDLMSDSGVELMMYDDKNGLAQVDRLSEMVITNIEQATRLINEAQERRQVGETNMNGRSSRSHTIIRIAIESHDILGGGIAARCSQINLVDLAGSESTAAYGTGIQNIRQVEGANINKSLLALSKVIQSLADKQKFVGFRDSKLTRLLKPCLGGNSKTVIICCVATDVYTETASTLKFARLAKKIQNKPVVNVASDDGKLSKCLAEIELLRKKLAENDALERDQEQREKLKELMEGILSGASNSDAAVTKRNRRMTWAPGKVQLTIQKSVSPPRKREKLLATVSENEPILTLSGSGSIEALNSSRESSSSSTNSAGRVSLPLANTIVDQFAIPKFVPLEERKPKKQYANIEVQTVIEEAPQDCSQCIQLNELVATLTEVNKEQEERIQKFESATESMKSVIGSFKDDVTQLNDLLQENKKAENEMEAKMMTLAAELRTSQEVANVKEAELKAKLSQSEISMGEKKRLQSKIDELNEQYASVNAALKEAQVKCTEQADELSGYLETIAGLRREMKQLQETSDLEKHERAKEKAALQHDLALLKESSESEATQLRAEVKKLKEESQLSQDVLLKSQSDEIELWKEKWQLSEESLAALKIQYDQLEANTVADIRGKVESRMKEYEDEAAQLKKANDDLTRRLEAVIQEAEHHEAPAVSDMSDKIKELMQEVERLTALNEENKTDSVKLINTEIKLQKLNQEHQNLRQQLERRDSAFEMLSGRMQDKRRELGEMEESKRQAKNEHDEAVEKLRKELEESKREATLTETKLKSMLSQMEAKEKIMKMQIEQLNKSAEEKRRKIFILETDVSIQKKELTAKDEALKTADAAVRKAVDEAVSGSKEQIETLWSKVSSLETELAIEKEARAAAEKQLALKQKLLERALEENDAAFRSSTNPKVDVRVKVEDADATTIENLKSQITSLSQELEEAKKKVDEQSEELVKLHKMRRKGIKLLHDQKAEIASMQAEHAKEKEELKKALADVKENTKQQSQSPVKSRSGLSEIINK